MVCWLQTTGLVITLQKTILEYSPYFFHLNITLVMQHAASQGNIASFLGIEYTHIVPDYLKAKIPVASKTRQPQGLLSGGDSVALAETVGNMAANL
jgi:1,4-dihydroxy-2-naphthoyl-CoA hydrolase